MLAGRGFLTSVPGLLVALDLTAFAQHAVRYDLYVSDTTVQYSDHQAEAIAINGHIPGPTLNFTEGDTADIYVHNLMDEETSIHWHGIILPNEQDGVPYLTTAPILPKSTHLYTFPIVQTGTYWYHSHAGFEEQMGLFGALILHKKQRDTTPEFPVVLSDWTNERPEEVMRTLAMANDWYAIEKGSTQSYGEALTGGYFGAKVEQEWLRMFPMDVSDVYYNAFLANGQIAQTLPSLKPGDRIRLRIINGSSSTYFWIQFSGGKLTVVANDGNDVVPLVVDRIIVGVAETYDVIVTIPDTMSYEFRATSEDRTNHTSLWLGSGAKMPAPTLPNLDYFEGMKMMNSMMTLDGTLNSMGMQMSNQEMDMNTVMYPELSGGTKETREHFQRKTSKLNTHMNTSPGRSFITLNYGMLKSPVSTTLPNAHVKVFHFTLTGNMNRFLWSINDKTLSEVDKIEIRRGENVRIVIDNQTMMRHPMHIHGHTFRLLNGHGDFDPLKNVLDIMPMETDSIEFAAQHYGDWFFHCHILYHMMSGMGRVFSYEEWFPNKELSGVKDAWQLFLDDDNKWQFSTFVGVQTNAIYPRAVIMNRDYVADATAAADYRRNVESDFRFGRLFGTRQFLEIYLGADFRSLKALHNISLDPVEYQIDNRTVATIGGEYVLPMFIRADLRLDHTGRARLQISRSDLDLTSRLRLDAMWNTDKEYGSRFNYIVTKRLCVTAGYDTHFGFGGGITFTY
jgi:CopA family copper-resistance protein